MTRIFTPEQKERNRAREREWYAKRTPEQIERKKARCRAWYKKTDDSKREAIKSYQKERRKTMNKEEHNSYNRLWYSSLTDDKKKEKQAAQNKTRKNAGWYNALALNNKRRARLKGNGGVFTKNEWTQLVDKFDHRCLKCGKQEPEIKLTVDHILPISKGGSNSIENIQPLCKSCNCKKGKQVEYYLKEAA